MNKLSHLQDRFFAQIMDENAPRPADWDARKEAGISIYRENYRSAIVSAITDLHLQTGVFLGAEKFRAFAIHHARSRPPKGWNIDEAAMGFADTLDDVAPEQPEAADLARLEWAMHKVSLAKDEIPLSMAQWHDRASDFAPDDWVALKLKCIACLDVLATTIDTPALFSALSQGKMADARASTGYVTVWREYEQPVATFQSTVDGEALIAARNGAPFGEIIAVLGRSMNEGAAAERAGQLLGSWLSQGWIADIAV